MTGDVWTELATAVSDGAPVDWTVLEQSDQSDDDRALLRELRVLAALAELHRNGDDAGLGNPSIDQPLNDLASWGPLRLIEPMGSGSYGQVYRAWDTRLDREVALKLFHQPVDTVEGIDSATVSEARLLARIRHPNVVTVYGAEAFGDRAGLWMEFIHGRTLAELLDANGTFSARETALIGVELCRALAAIHAAGLLHRDIKAQNVMREAGGRLVVMDFGAGHDSAAGVDCGLAGTPLYLAPEVLAGEAGTGRSDLYSLGVLLFHLCTNQYPLRGTSLSELVAAHTAGVRLRLRDIRPDLPEIFVSALERATATDPSRRFETGGAFESALADTLSIGSAGPRVPLEPSSRRRPVAIAAALVVVLAMAGSVWGLRQAGWHPSAAPRPSVEAITSVVVLPLENLTGDPGNDYVVDGLTGELIGALSRFPSLRVISHTSSMSYKHARPSLRRIAADLKVNGVVAGTLRQEGAQLRAVLAIADPRDDRTVWTMAWQDGPDRLSHLEGQMVEALAYEFRARTPETLLSRRRDDRELYEAYEWYLKGRFQLNKRTAEGLSKARDCFERALEIRPEYAEGYAGLADAYVLLGAFSILPTRDAFPKAEAAARRAIALDDRLAEPHAALGYLLADRDQPAAREAFEKSIERNPNYATARQWLALSVMSYAPSTAVAQIERARDLDPLSDIVSSDVAVVYKGVGRIDDAIAQLRRTLAVHPQFGEGHRQLGELLEGRRRYDEALNAFEEGARVSPDDSLILEGLVAAYGRADRRADASRVYQHLIDLSRHRFVGPLTLMIAAAAVGDVAAAITYGERGCEQKNSEAVSALSSGDDLRSNRLSKLRGTPQFDALVRRAEAIRQDSARGRE